MSATRWRRSQIWLTRKLKITIELAELLQFLTGWLASDPARLAASLRAYTAHPAYGLQQLRDDLNRFAFLLGGNDGEPLF
ncbi:MAG: hypothetical protein ACM3ML_21575, partial [Micromonosporaceae bacterium]